MHVPNYFYQIVQHQNQNVVEMGTISHGSVLDQDAFVSIVLEDKTKQKVKLMKITHQTLTAIQGTRGLRMEENQTATTLMNTDEIKHGPEHI